MQVMLPLLLNSIFWMACGVAAIRYTGTTPAVFIGIGWMFAVSVLGLLSAVHQ